MKAMVQQAYDLRRDLVSDVDLLGPYLHEGWMRKKTMANGISNPQIDQAYERALAAGATGGKLLGAGGSGFLLVYAPGEAKDQVRQALKGLHEYAVSIDSMGSTIIYSD
jgi:D-glycero-alpha-D-manno-heptose-7-phosphate kinase